MRRWVLGWAGVVMAALLLARAGHVRASASESSVVPPSPPASQRALLDQYCVTCHSSRAATAGLSLQGIDVETIRPGDAATWEKVIRKLRSGQMPPAGRPRPEDAAVRSLVEHLEAALDRLASADPNPGAPPAFHRLNRAEYTNAIRDLLGVEIDAAALLPADDAGHGFDTVAEMLAVSPLLVEGYLTAAAKVSRLAIGDPAIRPYEETYTVSRRLVQDDRVSDDLPFGTRGGMAVRVHVPVDGEYVVRVRLQRNKDNYIRGLGEPHQLDVRLDGVLLERFTVGGDHKGRSGVMSTFSDYAFWGEPVQQEYEFSADAHLNVRFETTAGTHLLGVAFLDETFESESELLPTLTYPEIVASGYKAGMPLVDRLIVSGPYNPRGVSDTPSRRRVFVCTPQTAKDEEPCAQRIVARLARRAYRRPVASADLAPLLDIYRDARRSQGFEAAVGLALQRLLVSPEFLFRRERIAEAPGVQRAYRISDLELASRLSFFLWSSIPDDELLELAERGELHRPAVLQAQIGRMLDDARAKALVRNFAGQWLSLRKLDALSPEPKVAPEFDDNLRDALRQETELFFESVLADDRNVLELLDADYTFVNERLARHYGFPDVFGSHFRRVRLPDARRRGLLGQGSILAVTSYANRTAPTLRGAWILENLLGAPPPPPPPNVPSLEEDGGGHTKPLTMRERMDLHRTSPACASCHQVMDPLGFALENFDSVGRWRDAEHGVAIDASGALASGETFEGPAGLRRVLLGRSDQFVHTFTEKLLTYAVGRGLEFSDGPAVRRIVRQAAGDGYRVRSLIRAIVTSEPFLMRRSRTS